MTFRFEQFADAPSAQAAFESAFAPASPAEPALQALVDMGAHCKSIGPGKVACRYLETRTPLAGFAWHVLLEVDGRNALRRVAIALAMLGT